MSPLSAVVLGMGILLLLALIKGASGHGWPTPRKIAGLWLGGFFLLLLGRASPQLAKGLTLIIVLAVILTQGGLPGISALTPKKAASPAPSPASTK